VVEGFDPKVERSGRIYTMLSGAEYSTNASRIESEISQTFSDN